MNKKKLLIGAGVLTIAGAAAYYIYQKKSGATAIAQSRKMVSSVDKFILDAQQALTNNPTTKVGKDFKAYLIGINRYDAQGLSDSLSYHANPANNSTMLTPYLAKAMWYVDEQVQALNGLRGLGQNALLA